MFFSTFNQLTHGLCYNGRRLRPGGKRGGGIQACQRTPSTHTNTLDSPVLIYNPHRPDDQPPPPPPPNTTVTITINISVALIRARRS
ncbi:hypothetical protein L2E82_25642 [Cichorium intybus]|uniref:Uncharacterized protein n=1 Tax=Cichorium intybus TaxID=13427 RepID=A0ACB9E3R0_CICIN|nr:hypothetical protein L2E82_25642 [Cichorium intybus]